MKALLESRIRLGFIAWKRALVPAIPASLPDRFRFGRIEIEGVSPFQAQSVTSTSRHGIDRARLSRRKVSSAVLLAPPDRVLRRDIELPVAALADLDAVLKLDIPISTPFEADEVLIGHKIVFPARRGTIRIATAIIPKATLQELEAQIDSELGGKPRLIALGEGIVIDADPQKAAGRTAARRLDILLTMLALTLAALVFWSAQSRQSQILREQRNRITTSLAALEQSAQLRRNIDIGQQRFGFVAGRQARAPEGSTILAKIAGLMPDNTFLTGLSVKGLVVHAVFAGATPTEPIRQIGEVLLEADYQLSMADDGKSVALSGQLKSKMRGGT